MSVLRIVSAELSRIFKTKWLLTLFLTIAIVVAGTLALSSGDSANSENWRDDATAHLNSLYDELEEYQASLETDSMGISEMFVDITQEEIELYEYSLEKDIPVNIKTAWQTVNDCTGNLWIVIVVLIVIYISMISDDYKYGTIKQIAIRPYSRTKILFGKQLAICIVSIGAFLCMFMISLGLGFIFNGSNGNHFIILEQLQGEIFEINIFNNICLMYLANFAVCLLVIQVASLCVILLKKSLVPLLITLGAYLCKDLVNSIFNNKEFYRYTIFPNMDLSQYIYGHEIAFTGNNLTFSLIVLVVHFVVITLCSYLLFARRDI